MSIERKTPRIVGGVLQFVVDSDIRVELILGNTIANNTYLMAKEILLAKFTTFRVTLLGHSPPFIKGVV
jgi:hypothetical protein